MAIITCVKSRITLIDECAYATVKACALEPYLNDIIIKIFCLLIKNFFSVMIYMVKCHVGCFVLKTVRATLPTIIDLFNVKTMARSTEVNNASSQETKTIGVGFANVEDGH